MLVPILLVIALPVAGVLLCYVGAQISPVAGARLVLIVLGLVQGTVASSNALGLACLVASQLGLTLLGLLLNVLGVSAILLAAHVGMTRLVSRRTVPASGSPAKPSHSGPGQPPPPPDR